MIKSTAGLTFSIAVICLCSCYGTTLHGAQYMAEKVKQQLVDSCYGGGNEVKLHTRSVTWHTQTQTYGMEIRLTWDGVDTYRSPFWVEGTLTVNPKTGRTTWRAGRMNTNLVKHLKARQDTKGAAGSLVEVAPARKGLLD